MIDTRRLGSHQAIEKHLKRRVRRALRDLTSNRAVVLRCA
jgi:hypothetical protein